jgi:hypothetical protein
MNDKKKLQILLDRWARRGSPLALLVERVHDLIQPLGRDGR